jgi:SAM-dependent methyltransferase
MISLYVMSPDLLAEKLAFNNESIDASTSFYSIEHWHHSPRQLFCEIARVLKPNGFWVIECPDTVNLRKRLWVLLGKTNLCSLNEWYYDGDLVFREHVREATVCGLERLLEGKGFVTRHVARRNSLGAETTVIGNT